MTKRKSKEVSHVLTIRAVGHNAILLKNVMHLTNSKTATNAVFEALRAYEYNLTTISELNTKLNECGRDLFRANEALNHFKAFTLYFDKPKQTEKEAVFNKRRPQLKIEI